MALFLLFGVLNELEPSAAHPQKGGTVNLFCLYNAT